MESTNHPLQMTDIVVLVLGHLNEDRDGEYYLYQCAQVNHLWAELATKLLWSGASPWMVRHAEDLSKGSLSRLYHFPKPHRKQYYANEIREMHDINVNFAESVVEEFHLRLSTLRFPRLKAASMWIANKTDERSCVQYLQPAIRRLNIYQHFMRFDAAFLYWDFNCGPLSSEFFDEIKVRACSTYCCRQPSLDP